MSMSTSANPPGDEQHSAGEAGHGNAWLEFVSEERDGGQLRGSSKRQILVVEVFLEQSGKLQLAIFHSPETEWWEHKSRKARFFCVFFCFWISDRLSTRSSMSGQKSSTKETSTYSFSSWKSYIVKTMTLFWFMLPRYLGAFWFFSLFYLTPTPYLCY